MENNEKQNNEQDKELRIFGFLTDKSRRGIVTWFMVILVFLNVVQAFYIWTYQRMHERMMNKMIDAHDQIMHDVIIRQNETEKRVDTTIVDKFRHITTDTL